MNRIDNPDAPTRAAAEEMLRVMANKAPETFASSYDARREEASPEPLRRIVFSSQVWRFSQRANADLAATSARCSTEVMEMLANDRDFEARADLEPLCFTDEDVLRHFRDVASDKSQTAYARWTAIHILGDSRDVQSIPFLESLVDDTVFAPVALIVLKTIGGVKEMAKLISEGRPASESTDFPLLLTMVAGMSAVECVPLLRERYEKADGNVKLPLAATMIRCGCAEFAPTVEQAMTEDIGTHDLCYVLEALPHMDKAKRPQYIKFVRDKALNNDASWIRSVAVDCLSAMGDLSVSELFKLALSENDKYNAKHAVEHIGDLSIAEDDVQDLLKLSDQAMVHDDTDLAFCTTEAIALGGGPIGVALLEDRARQRGASTGLISACALWSTGHGEFKAQVIEGISGMEESTREDCAAVFRRHAGPEDMWTVLQLLDNKDVGPSIHREMLGTFFELLYKNANKQ